MGFLIPLRIKINFLFYPWSAQSRRGLELPAWEKFCRLMYTTKHQAKPTYGNWLLFHLPSRSHPHSFVFDWQQGGRSQRKVSSGCQRVLIRRRHGGMLRMPTCHESPWMRLRGSGWEGRSKEGKGEKEGTQWPEIITLQIMYCTTFFWL